jgi:predicted PurR-regulated permease PerM
LLASVITILFLRLIWSFVLPLLMAAVMAGLASPVYRRFVKLFRNHKAAASAVTVFLSLCLVTIPVLLLIGIVANEAIEIAQASGDWLKEHISEQKIQDIPALQQLLPYQDQVVEKAGQLAGKAASFVAQALVGGATGAARFFLLLFIALYAMFFFLKDSRAILDWIFAYTPLSVSEKQRLVSTFNSVARATIKGTFVIGIVQGGLAGAAFAVAGIEGAVFWGVIMTVLSIIPGIGTALVWVPAVIYLAMIGRVGAAVGLALWCAIVVGTADNILRPVLVGKDTKMPDLLILVTTLGGLILFGAAGIVVGPIIGALFITVWNLCNAAIKEAKLVSS